MDTVDINEFTDVAVSFVNVLADEIIPTATLWVDRSIRAAVNARTATYKAGLATGDISAYEAASLSTWRT